MGTNTVIRETRGGVAEALPVEIDEHKSLQHFDLVVIGGGSGGIACAREASKLGARVAMLDFVKPSPQGSSWGLGGTCVNVGCIPKKLMHEAGSIGSTLMERAPAFGWQPALDSTGGKDSAQARYIHNWQTLVSAVQNHIKSLNFKYRVDMRAAGVTYINDLGRFVSPDTLELVHTGQKIIADKFVIAVGGRPKILDIPGGDLAITSDDLFSLRKLSKDELQGQHANGSGRILIVGGSYVALECAGFLTEIGVEVDVMYRSLLLRGFDRDMASRIESSMILRGTRFLAAVPTSIKRTDDGCFEVTSRESTNDRVDKPAEKKGKYDLVLSAVGRYADTSSMGLTSAGVETEPSTGKILCDRYEKTSAENMYVRMLCIQHL